MLKGEKILIRADMSSDIGMGHFMRCSALAEKLSVCGAEVVFFGRCGSQQMRRMIDKSGFKFIEAPCCDFDELKLALSISYDFRPAWLIIDGYQFTPLFQKAIREAGFKLLVIDDYNHHSHYYADILLNQNISAERLNYVHNPETVCLFGSDYILIRNEFLEYVKQERRSPPMPKRLLVTLGGADPGNVTMKVIHALQRLDFENLEIDLIMGPVNPHFEIIKQEIQKWISSHKRSVSNVNLLKNPLMPKFMNKADIAITAGGSTCYEMAFMGVPMMIIILAKNQEGIATAMEENKAAVNLGWYTNLSENRIMRKLKQIIYSPKSRNDLCAKGRAICDGLGSTRVIEHIQALS